MRWSSFSSQPQQYSTVLYCCNSSVLLQYLLCNATYEDEALTLWRANSWGRVHGSDPSSVPRTITQTTTYQWKCHRWFLCPTMLRSPISQHDASYGNAGRDFHAQHAQQLTHSICASSHRWEATKTSHQGWRWDNDGENKECINQDSVKEARSSNILLGWQLAWIGGWDGRLFS